MIGLIDYDLYLSTTNKKIGLPNLEIMKLSEYYKIEKGEYVKLILPQEKDFEGYEKIYFRSDTTNNIPDYYKNKKITFGGIAFEEGNYIPLENELMEYSLPRTNIYKNFLSEKFSQGMPAKEINNFLDNTYYRIYYKNEILPIPRVKTNKKVFIYDKEFFIPNIYDILKEISDRKPSGIYRIFPIYCENFEQFLDIRKIPKFSRANEIIFNYKKNFEEVKEEIKKYYKILKAEITFINPVYIPFGYDKDSPKTILSYSRELIRGLNMLYLFWSKDIPIKLKYLKPPYGENNPYESLFIKAEHWSNLIPANYKDKELRSLLVRGKEKNQFKELLKYFPYSNNLFKQTYSNLKTMGGWDYDRQRSVFNIL